MLGLGAETRTSIDSHAAFDFLSTRVNTSSIIGQNAVSTASKLEPRTFNRLERGKSVTLFIGDALCLRPDGGWPLIYCATYDLTGFDDDIEDI